MNCWLRYYWISEFCRAHVSTEFERDLHVDCRPLRRPRHSGGIYVESLMHLLEVKTNKLRWEACPLCSHFSFVMLPTFGKFRYVNFFFKSHMVHLLTKFGTLFFFMGWLQNMLVAEESIATKLIHFINSSHLNVLSISLAIFLGGCSQAFDYL
jgi:hypothetical protein